MFTSAIGAFAGALLSLVISVYIEYQRKPKLYFEIEEPPHEHTFSSGPVQEARFLRVNLCNRAMPQWLRWLGRNAAMQCEGNIQFYHMDNGAPVFSKPMPIRWAGSDEPLSFHVLPDGQVGPIFDPSKYNAISRRNCFPGSKETIDVAARFDNDEECYGWCNENYLPAKGWRNGDWRLAKGRYITKVTVLSAGEKVSEVFQIENSVAKKHFRLMAAKHQDVFKIGSNHGTY
jgi:hypothetical protein